MNDLELMSYRQVRDLIEINAFYADAAAHRDEDRRSREAESRFWSSFDGSAPDGRVASSTQLI